MSLPGDRMMVIPVSQHKLIKIRRANRKKLTRLALYCSLGACICSVVNEAKQKRKFLVIGSTTNNWLYTSEVLKYYVLPNHTRSFDDTQPNQPVYFKNASFGPWQFCWLDPMTAFHCNNVQYLIDEDASDVTTSVQQTIRRAFIFMIIGGVLDILGVINSAICCALPRPYSSLFTATIIHINAGIANFLCIIVFMSAVSKEVGNKIHPASEMDDPLFHFEYGFSFILLKASFLLTELAALFSIIVYMAKRDERTFNRYKIRSLLNVSMRSRSMSEDKTDSDIVRSSVSHPSNLPARFNKGRRPGISSPMLSSMSSFDKVNSPTKSIAKQDEDIFPSPGELFRPSFGQGSRRSSSYIRRGL